MKPEKKIAREVGVVGAAFPVYHYEYADPKFHELAQIG